MNEKIKELLVNEAFAAELEKVETVEEIKALFAAHGVQVTDEELTELIKQPAMADADELSEEDMEMVSGGSAVTLALKALGWTWKFAVKVYGSPSKAIKGITKFWKKKLGL